MKNKKIETPITTNETSVKKRGRPKKNKVKPHVNIQSDDEISSDDNLILKLNISESDTEVDTKKKNMLSLSSKFHSDNISSDDSSSDSDSSSSDEEDMANQIKILKSQLQIKNGIINDLKKKLDENKFIEAASNTGIKEVNLTLINLKLIDISTGKPVIANKTNIACFWDTEKFDTQPWFLPDYYNNGSYHVFNCFCSVNCADAYNNNLDDSRSDVRRMLLRKMYREAIDITSPVNIIPSPSPELLEKFGGPLSLQKYRDKLLLTKKDFKIKIPPSMPLIGCMEEINRKQ